jgi:hypothetical protein
MPFSTIFQLYVAVSFIGGENQSNWKKPVTCRSDENIHIYTNIAEVDPS